MFGNDRRQRSVRRLRLICWRNRADAVSRSLALLNCGRGDADSRSSWFAIRPSAVATRIPMTGRLFGRGRAQRCVSRVRREDRNESTANKMNSRCWRGVITGASRMCELMSASPRVRRRRTGRRIARTPCAVASCEDENGIPTSPAPCRSAQIGSRATCWSTRCGAYASGHADDVRRWIGLA